MNADTTSKRRSVVQLLQPAFATPPSPDGTIGEGDREHIALMYSGISAQVVQVSYPGQQSWGGTMSLYGLGAGNPRRRRVMVRTAFSSANTSQRRTRLL